MVLKEFMWEVLGPCVTGSLFGGRCFVFYNLEWLEIGSVAMHLVRDWRWFPYQSPKVCVVVVAVY